MLDSRIEDAWPNNGHNPGTSLPVADSFISSTTDTNSHQDRTRTQATGHDGGSVKTHEGGTGYMGENSGMPKVPVEYHDLREVFCKSRATCLPPHRPYNCAIDLKHRSTPPEVVCFRCLDLRRRPWRSTSERLSLLASSALLHHPLDRDFSLWGKKYGSLRPCIDYQGINEITIKNRYPLPLMTTAFKLLQGATTFTKLDLWNAYHLVHIREGD